MVPLISADPHGDYKRHLAGCEECQAFNPFLNICLEGNALFVASVARTRWEMNRRGSRKAWELIRAGWKFELPDSDDPEIMSWYWRRPPRRKGTSGRKFHSTDQAHNAMKKESE